MALNFAAEPNLILLLDPHFKALGFSVKDSVKEDGSAKGVHSTDALAKRNPDRQIDTTHRISDAPSANDPSCDGIDTPIETGVSKSHLVESSRYFRKLLSGPFSEASEASPNALKRVTLKEVALPEFEILMNVIHLQNRNVPRKVDAESLYKLCCLIDMYEMHEATVLWTDMWFGPLRDQIPRVYTPHLRHWAFICYVTYHPECFRALTALIQRNNKCEANDCEVPLPPRFDDLLQQSCTDANARCTDSLRALIRDYEDTSKIRCALDLEECDELVLGSLCRALKEAKVDPRPDADSGNAVTMTIDERLRKMQTLRVQNYCALLDKLGVTRHRRNTGFGFSNTSATARLCGCKDRLCSICARLESDTSGMELNQLPGKFKMPT